jgi:hypothetical protein
MRRSPSLLLCIGLLAASCGDGAAPASTTEKATTTAATTASAVEITTTTAATTTATPPETTETAPEEGDYPLGLSAEDLPATMPEVHAVFEAMPDEIDGVTRDSAQYGFEARYGELNGLMAVEVAAGTCSESMSFFENDPGAVVEASQLDPAEPLLWLFGSFQDEGGAGAVRMAQWCEPEGTWIFGVNAEPAMRDALVAAFVETAHAVMEAGPVEATGDIAALEALRETLPTTEDLVALLGITDLSLEVTGGPGITDWIFEHTDLPGLIGGYLVGLRNPEGLAGNGSLSVTLFESEADAAVVLEGIPEEEAEEAGMIRSEFPVTDLLTEGMGRIYNPEADSYFTDIIGYTGPVLIHVLVFHSADDDMIDQTRELVETVVAELEGIG